MGWPTPNLITPILSPYLQWGDPSPISSPLPAVELTAPPQVLPAVWWPPNLIPHILSPHLPWGDSPSLIPLPAVRWAPRISCPPPNPPALRGWFPPRLPRTRCALRSTCLHTARSSASRRHRRQTLRGRGSDQRRCRGRSARGGPGGPTWPPAAGPAAAAAPGPAAAPARAAAAAPPAPSWPLPASAPRSLSSSRVL